MQKDAIQKLATRKNVDKSDSLKYSKNDHFMKKGSCDVDLERLPTEAKIIHKLGHGFVRDNHENDSTINEDSDESDSGSASNYEDESYFIARKVSTDKEFTKSSASFVSNEYKK